MPPLWHFCFLCLDCHQLLTTGRVSGPCYTGMPLEAQADEHKSLQIPDKICSRTMALLFFKITVPKYVFDTTVSIVALKKNCKMSQIFGILCKYFGISLHLDFLTISKLFIYYFLRGHGLCFATLQFPAVLLHQQNSLLLLSRMIWGIFNFTCKCSPSSHMLYSARMPGSNHSDFPFSFRYCFDYCLSIETRAWVSKILVKQL